MSELINYIMQLAGSLDYTSIFFLMALESSIFPVPSEAVMIPAGYLVQTGELNLIITILIGTLGSLLGAIINYFILGQFIGKPFLLKYGKYILISHKKYHKAEDLFLRNDKLYTFLGRLLPVIRHLISIPAGVFKMNFFYFCVITSLGAALWCSILVGFGYFFGQGVLDIFHKYTSEANIIIGILVVIFTIYFIKKK
ncbi:MAG: DedA family protein [Candidatus Gracilibacteria bacterium]